MDRQSVTYHPRVDRARETDQEWWLQDGTDVWRHVIAVANAIESAQEARKATYIRNARLYSNRELVGLGVGQYQKTVTRKDESKLTLNLVRSCIGTAAAKIAKNKPRPVYVGQGSDERITRKAKARTKYIEGLYDETSNWHLMQRQFVDGCIYGTGFKRWYIDGDRVKAERILCNEILIDEDEGRYGDPRQSHIVRPMLRARLERKFPGKRDEIRRLSTTGTSARDVDFVKVYESVHLPDDAEGTNGRHTICIDGAVLYDGPHKDPFFHHTAFRWADALEGYHGESLVEELVPIQIEVNRLLRTIQQAQRLACVPRVFLQAGSKITNEITNEIGGHYEYVGQPPVISTAQGMPAEIYQHLENLIRKAYEITGVSQLSASSKKPAGITAGVAIRELQDIESERFVLPGQRYEELALDDARVVLALTAQLAKAGKPPRVSVLDGKVMKPIDWDDADLDEDRYIVRPHPAAFLPATTAGKLQRVAEMQETKLIETREEALELLDYPDLESWTSLAIAPREAVKIMLETILEEGRIIRPTPQDDPDICRKLGNLHLKRAEVQGVSEHKRELILQWLDMVDEVHPPAPPTMPMGPPQGPPGMPGGMDPSMMPPGVMPPGMAA